MDPKNKADLDNHANQKNDNNDAYWKSRGYDSRPDDWDDDVKNNSSYDDDDNRASEDYYDNDFEWSDLE